MSNGIEMNEEQFDELSLESKLTALFTKAVKNGLILAEIHEVCRCREIACNKKFDELKHRVTAKAIVEKSIATISGSVAGFFGGLFGGHMS